MASVAPKSLLAASALFFGAAYFTVRFPDVPGAEVGSYVSTFLIALPSLLALLRYLGPKSAAVSLLCLSAFGYAIEITGVATGVPYGAFYYGDALGPRMAGLVPYLLPLSWVPLVLGAVAATVPGRTRESRKNTSHFTLHTSHFFRAAVLLVLVDGVLDPGAARLGFWTWPEGGVYYGIPVTNYLGWFFSSCIAAALLIVLGRRRWEGVPPPPGLLDSLAVAVAFWTGVAVFSGLLLPAALGGALYLYLLRCRGRLTTHG